MYNTLFGVNNLALFLLMSIDVMPDDIQRFRDVILKKDDEHGYVVEILTRTGGANREAFPQPLLISHKNYIKDYDDEYDCTYAHYIFKIDDKAKDIIKYDKVLADQSRSSLNLREMFEKEFKEMKTEGTDANKRAKQMADGLNKIIEADKIVATKKSKKAGNNIKILTVDDIMAAGERKEDES